MYFFFTRHSNKPLWIDQFLLSWWKQYIRSLWKQIIHLSPNYIRYPSCPLRELQAAFLRFLFCLSNIDHWHRNVGLFSHATKLRKCNFFLQISSDAATTKKVKILAHTCSISCEITCRQEGDNCSNFTVLYGTKKVYQIFLTILFLV